MTATYNDVLERLKEERIRLSLSQMQMAQIVRMTQSNYSKIELGSRRLTYHELKYLCESEADVHYIFTGRKSCNKYTDFLETCDYSELSCFLSIIYSVVVLHNRKRTTDGLKDILGKLSYVPFIENGQASKNIFLALRLSMDCRQTKMAESLGVDIKKYRNLEKGRGLPDSELLWRLYDMFNIPPLLLLKDRHGLISEISWLLDRVETENGHGLFEGIKMLHEMS